VITRSRLVFAAHVPLVPAGIVGVMAWIGTSMHPNPIVNAQAVSAGLFVYLGALLVNYSWTRYRLGRIEVTLAPIVQVKKPQKKQ
jgi:hypothetical protein